MARGWRQYRGRRKRLGEAAKERELEQSDGGQDDATKNRFRVSGPIEVSPLEVKFLQEIAQEFIRNNEGGDSREKQRFHWEKAAVCVAGLLAALTLLQAFITQESVREQRRQFHLDQRPYIKIDTLWFSDFETHQKIEEPVIGKVMVVNIPYRNIGKSVASALTIERMINFGPAFTKLKQRDQTVPHGHDFVMPTDEGLTSAMSRKDYYTQSAFLPDNMQLPWDGSQPVILLAHFHYKDSFGGFYCTPIVARYMGKGQWLKLDLPNAYCEDRPSDW